MKRIEATSPESVITTFNNLEKYTLKRLREINCCSHCKWQDFITLCVLPVYHVVRLAIPYDKILTSKRGQGEKGGASALVFREHVYFTSRVNVLHD